MLLLGGKARYRRAKQPAGYSTAAKARRSQDHPTEHAQTHNTMAGASATRPADPPTQAAGRGRVSTKPIPAALVPAAVLLAVVVAVLSLLPSVAQAVWELPQLFLLGLVVSYGVFAQNHKNAAAAGDDAAANKDGGARAWSSRYHPDDPLVVVADHAASVDDDGEDYCAGGRPFSLPVRRLKPVAEEPEAGGARSDDTAIDEETASSAASSTAGFWAGAPGAAAPSPPSVIDAFDSRKYDNAAAATAQPSVSKGFPGYDDDSLSLPRDDRSSFNDEAEEEDEGTDWDEDVDGLMDDMTAASSERSFPGDFVACGNRVYNHDGDGEGESADEELLELAKKAGPEGEDEVDRKADEFIAKFREQIRLQRLS